MRLPRVRFTVRRMMVAVAGFAVVLGVGFQGYRCCDDFRRSERHALSAHLLRTAAREIPPSAVINKAHLGAGGHTFFFSYGPSAVGMKRGEVVEECLRQAEAYDRLSRSHRFAALHPWLSRGPPGPLPPPFVYDSGSSRRPVSPRL